MKMIIRRTSKHILGQSRPQPFISTTFNTRYLSAQPSLDIELPGVPALSPASTQPKPETKISTLANGLRVASQETYGQVASIGLFVDAGSKYESYNTNGVSHFLEHMAFKSTEKRSHLRLVRDLEEIGATVAAASSREAIMYTSDCLREDVEAVMEILADSILKPKLAAWDVDAAREVISYQLGTLEENAQSLLTEILHAAAFGENSSLGRSLWCPQRNISKIDSNMIKAFMKRHFVKSKMVLSAAGVDHDRFVSLAEKYFMDSANYETFDVQASDDVGTAKGGDEYVGGIKIVESESPLTHMAMGFNPGNWFSDHLVDVCTLHFLLGGGGSFSAGGPGKGMYSRLYTECLNKHGWLDSCIAFNSLYNTSGLFGIYAACPPSSLNILPSILTEQLLSLRDKKIESVELERAKAQLKSSVLMRLETRQVLSEDIGRQVLTYGKRETPESLSTKIDAVTESSLKKAVKKMLESKLTVAVLGNAERLPKYDQMASSFK